jgi:hypothetical protein
MIHIPEFLNNNSKGGGFVGTIPTTNLITDMDPTNYVYSDAGTTLAVNNTLVQQWKDSSVNAYWASQPASGDRPLFKTGGSKGFPYVYFTGLEWMRMTGTSNEYKQQDITIYFVGTVEAPGGYDHFFHKGLDRYLDNGWGLQMNGTGYHQMWTNNEGVYNATSPTYTLSLAVRAGRFKLSSIPRYLNARMNSSADGTDTPPTLTNAPTKDACLGAAWYDSGTTTATYFYKGHMYRLLIYAGYHDDVTYANTITTLKNMYI